MQNTDNKRTNNDDTRKKYIVLPLRKDFPLPLEPDWISTICLGCGRSAWYRPMPDRRIHINKCLCPDCIRAERKEIVHG